MSSFYKNYSTQKDASALLPPPNKSNTWTMCSLPLVSGAVARLCTSVHGSVSVVHGVHVCPECRWP